MGECRHAVASLWLEHAPKMGLVIGPRQPQWLFLVTDLERQSVFPPKGTKSGNDG